MIKAFADWLTYIVFKMTAGTHLADAVNFFIYDTIKIFLLLGVIIFIVVVAILGLIGLNTFFR